MTTMVTRRSGWWSACVALAWAPAAALAQATTDPATLPGGFDAHGFHLVAYDADLRDPLTVQRPGAFSQGDWFVSGLGEYAKAPLVLVQQPSNGGESSDIPLVDNLVAMNLSAGVAAFDQLRFDVVAPVYGLSTGADLTSQGPAMGDMRLSAMVVPIRPKMVSGGGGPGLGVVGFVDLPTGNTSRFLGSGAVRGGARLTGTLEVQRLTLSGDVGGVFGPRLDDLANVEGADRLTAALGVGVLASDVVGFTLEAIAQPPLEAPTFDAVKVAPPAEGLLSMRYRSPSGGHLTFGGAAGLTEGPGVAAFRVFVGGGFGKQEPPRPPDFDPLGVLRSTDQCPTEREVVNGWRDDDGCADKLSSLVVDVRYQGQSREADAEIVGPAGPQVQRVPASGLALDAVPGSRWQVRASSGCLTGSAEATATEAGAQLVVELQPIYDSKVEVLVQGTDGLPLPTATVAWQSASPECAPTGQADVDASGVVVQRIANGTHKLVVTAPAHTVYEEEVTVRPGDDKRLVVQLGAALISVEKTQIRILEKVQFETAKAIIKPESFPLLNEVAAVIVTNPDLGRVEVSGHTDNRGSDTYNQTLSEDRAKSVRDYLVKQGVNPDRLLAVGYGEAKPIDTNRTDEGREVNRRVEFNLIDAASDETQGGTP